MSDCIFCKIAQGAIPSAKVYEDDQCYAFRDIHPEAPVHVLVIPKRHVADALEGAATPGLMEALMAAAARAAALEGLDQTGCRLVINNGEDAQQSVAHLHVLILGGRKLAWPPG